MTEMYQRMTARIKELETAIEQVIDKKASLSLLLGVMANDVHLQQKAIIIHSRIYYPTGKWGNRMTDGMMCREYRNRDDGMDRRAWIYRDGTVTED